MRQKEIIWIPNPSFMIGNYKVVINDSISMELYNTLKKLLVTLDEVNKDKNILLKRFVCHISVDLLLPVQVCCVPHVFVD